MRARDAILPLLLASLLPAAARAEDPHVLYMLNCQGCHGPDGAGIPGEVPSLAGVARFAALEGGREYLIRVPGSAQSPLDDAALAAVLNWMLTEFGPSDLAARLPPFDAAEVARCRKPLERVDETRARLVEELASRADDLGP